MCIWTQTPALTHSRRMLCTEQYNMHILINANTYSLGYWVYIPSFIQTYSGKHCQRSWLTLHLITYTNPQCLIGRWLSGHTHTLTCTWAHIYMHKLTEENPHSLSVLHRCSVWMCVSVPYTDLHAKTHTGSLRWGTCVHIFLRAGFAYSTFEDCLG